MNCANASGFFGLGLVMWLLPLLFPGLFPHTAIDGSSTRALWTATMGVVQCALGGFFLLRHFGPLALAGTRRFGAALLEGARGLVEQRGALATSDWLADAMPTNVVSVDLSAATAANLRERVILAHGLVLPTDVAARWRQLVTLSAAEARLTNLLGRPAEARPIA
jgi:hypothetical protein